MSMSKISVFVQNFPIHDESGSLCESPCFISWVVEYLLERVNLIRDGHSDSVDCEALHPMLLSQVDKPPGWDAAA